MLPTRNKSQDEYSGSISDSIDCNQMKISYLKLAFITEKNNDQTGKVQLAFVVKIIDRELYIL